ncbi:DedA family protein [Shewanella putrefaciens]|uniref:DedA family protein n=1 Tax=Shewanella putrefaciens TaxID=24 RepID=UPI0018E87B49|nr:DedA family protein [Shewanella putrefaciens]
MPEVLQHLITEMTPWLQQYGYLLLFIAIALEGFGIPAPGQSLLIVASLLAATGQMSLPLVLVVAACGALSGNSLGYLIGWRFGDVLLKKGWIKPQLEDKIHGIIGQYGIAALVLSRFVEGLKQFMFIGCGLAKMPLKQFVIGNVLATSIWVTLFGLGPVLIRDEIAPMLAFYHLHKYPTWAIVSLLMAFLLILTWRKWQTKNSQ